MRSGTRLRPEEPSVCATVWMDGAFCTQLAQGHVCLGTIMSLRRSYLGLDPASGLRLFVRSEAADDWLLLGTPSAWRVAVDECRWWYATGRTLLEIRTRLAAEADVVTVKVTVLDGPPVEVWRRPTSVARSGRRSRPLDRRAGRRTRWCRRPTGPRPRCSRAARCTWTGVKAAVTPRMTACCSATVGPAVCRGSPYAAGPRTEMAAHPAPGELVVATGEPATRAGLLAPDRRRGHPRDAGYRRGSGAGPSRHDAALVRSRCRHPLPVAARAGAVHRRRLGHPRRQPGTGRPCCSPSARTELRELLVMVWPPRTHAATGHRRSTSCLGTVGPAGSGRARRRRLLAVAGARQVPPDHR